MCILTWNGKFESRGDAEKVTRHGAKRKPPPIITPRKPPDASPAPASSECPTLTTSACSRYKRGPDESQHRKDPLPCAMDTSRLAFLLLLLAAAAAPLASAQLSSGFYKSSCPDAEKTIQAVVERKFKEDPGTAPSLLRLLFHDCFANGCDGSILIDPMSNSASEKEAGSNISVTGYDIIDEIKEELEKQCKETVSCADIVAVAARDAVKLTGGPDYDVQTGRRDSVESNREDADNMPSPDIPIPKLTTEFTDRGFTPEEMLLLLAGGHTIGTCKCFFIEMDTAPIDPDYKKNITSTCDGPKGAKAAVPLDHVTPNAFDGTYFANVMAKQMPLTFDRLLGVDSKTEPLLKSLEGKSKDFSPMFAKAMVKLSALKVLTGKDGEVRKTCTEPNNPKPSEDGPSVIRISSLQPDGGLAQPGAAVGQPGAMAQPGAAVAQPGAMPEPGAAAVAQPRKVGGHQGNVEVPQPNLPGGLPGGVQVPATTVPPQEPAGAVPGGVQVPVIPPQEPAGKAPGGVQVPVPTVPPQEPAGGLGTANPVAPGNVNANAGQGAVNPAASLEDNKAIRNAETNKVLGDEPGSKLPGAAEERKPKLRGGQ
ncbi:hypothetical protein ACP70R_013003 [Stipagrostis hirtigluma subsp. patula]